MVNIVVIDMIDNVIDNTFLSTHVVSRLARSARRGTTWVDKKGQPSKWIDCTGLYRTLEGLAFVSGV